jgi:hypothetical protein
VSDLWKRSFKKLVLAEHGRTTTRYAHAHIPQCVIPGYNAVPLNADEGAQGRVCGVVSASAANMY